MATVTAAAELAATSLPAGVALLPQRGYIGLRGTLAFAPAL